MIVDSAGMALNSMRFRYLRCNYSKNAVYAIRNYFLQAAFCPECARIVFVHWRCYLVLCSKPARCNSSSRTVTEDEQLMTKNSGEFWR